MEELDNVKKESNVPKKTILSDTELTLDDMEMKYVNSPKVGEATEWLKIVSMRKTQDTQKTDKDGNAFSIALDKVDFGVIANTDKGDLTISSWEVYKKVSQACKDNGSIPGTQVKLMHIANGFSDKSAVKEKRCFKVLSKDKEDKEYEVTI